MFIISANELRWVGSGAMNTSKTESWPSFCMNQRQLTLYISHNLLQSRFNSHVLHSSTSLTNMPHTPIRSFQQRLSGIRCCKQFWSATLSFFKIQTSNFFCFRPIRHLLNTDPTIGRRLWSYVGAIGIWLLLLTKWKKRWERRKHYALAVVRRSQKFSPHRRPLPGDAGRPKFNQLETVATFNYKPSLARIDARNFELSYRGNRPTNKQTHPQTH